MKLIKRIITIFSIFILVILNLGHITSFASNESTGLVNIDTLNMDEIDKQINAVLSDSGTEGASVVIVSDKQTVYRSYGYSNRSDEMKIDQHTLFELGSNSKAFTALGILYLEKQGLLSLNDSVKEYIPWFNVMFNGNYEGKYINSEVDLTIENLLYHTSGIPYNTIGDIPEGNSDDMLEKTVRLLENTKLDFFPGEKYSYTTINYDVLGLIIQNITGTSYEKFIKENILVPLGLNDTYLFRSEATETGRMSSGFKSSFFTSKEFDAPIYRGNTPAGYYISSASDMEKWLKIQMGIIDVPDQFKDIIQKSHIGNSTVASADGYYYAGGWLAHIKGEKLEHSGSNPNFSSMAIIKPKEKLGIYVLSNLNSNAPSYIASTILNTIEGKDNQKYKTDSYRSLDIIFSIVTIGCSIIAALFLVLLCKALIEVKNGTRKRVKFDRAKVAGVFLAVPLIVFYGYCIYYSPNILFYRLSWDAVGVWGSPSIILGCIIGFITGVIFMGFVLLIFNYPKDNEKGYAALIPLCIINGVTSALIIFSINESFNRNLEYSKELLIYFSFALIFFVYSMKLLQGKLILLANEIIFEKRMSMTNKLMNSSYQAVERIGSDRIHSGLNNDTAAISNMPGVIVRLVSDAMTLIFCLGFLFFKSKYAFFASISIVVLNGILSIVTSRVAGKYWEENRNIQDTFFGQLSDLIKGFKELVLNKVRKHEFFNDIKKYARLSTELNKAASIRVLNFDMYNTLMYNIVFGIVVFVFPLFIININVNDLREVLFVVFYMIGPFGTIAWAIPQITAMRINMRRIDGLIQEFEDVSSSDSENESRPVPIKHSIHIEFKDVCYTYQIQNMDAKETCDEFTLGPVNLEFKSGEITFIIGGNGSGKSTLSKLITGLYSPARGSITINGHPAGLEELNDSFSSIFSDFHLFKKLYGIDYRGKKDELSELIRTMGLEGKIQVNHNGEFNSLDLSTGQRKRLAFIVSCLEDKPMMLFDEWAAEQDPEFRHFFYKDLLPLLKRNGKGVIIVTHDDRYFELADNLIKLERGEVIRGYENSIIGSRAILP